MTNNNILTETGTNELELLEFSIGANMFGINVIKVKEIITPIPLTVIPHSHPHVEGIVELRGEVLTVIDVAKVLGFEPSPNPKNDKYIVTEFNQQKIVFHVHDVTQIYRITWKQIEKPSESFLGQQSVVTGVVRLENKMMLMLDFEKIMVDINPNMGIKIDQLRSLGHRERSNKKVVIAEDSPLLRQLLLDTLSESGYSNLEFFENGEEALNYLEKVATTDNISDKVNIVITDIEMPQMDGHHLTKRIREDVNLQKLPIIIFSSLITDDLRHKGIKIGATAQVSKPEINELVKLIDTHIL